MNRKITRRRLAAAAFASAAAARANQTTAPPATEDPQSTARERLRKNADALAKTNLPMFTEPAFSFKA